MRSPSRRQFLQGGLALAGVGLASGCGVVPLPWGQATKIPRVGVLLADGSIYAEALVDGLRDLGYVEGHNLTVEWRSTGGSRERVPEVLAQLVALDVDAIVVTGATSARAAQNATRTIPVVIVIISDPLEGGFVANLARPGGNITGLGSFALELSGKQLQLLREAIPSLARVGVLWQRSHPSKVSQLKEIQDAAAALGIEVESLAVSGPQELASAVQAGIQARVDALFPLHSDLTVDLRAPIIELAAQARLPAMYEIREWTEAGGLLSYGPSFPAMHRRAASYVDKILKGAKPADIPIERPTEFEFMINLKTARALGLTISQSVLQQATEIIQ